MHERLDHYPLVYIVVLNWNGLNDTELCLQSLQAITYPNYKIVVVDNGSTGNDQELLYQRYGDWIDVIQTGSNLGFSGGNNCGIKYAMSNNPDYILLLNNDTIVAPGFLEELVIVGESNKLFGILGPVVYLMSDERQIQSAGVQIENGLLVTLKFIRRVYPQSKHTKFRVVDLIDGPALLIKKEVVERIGIFDPSLFFYHEVVDYCIRAKNNDYKTVIVTESSILHAGGNASSKIANAFREYHKRRSWMIVSRRHFGDTACINYIFRCAGLILFYFLTGRINVGIASYRGLCDGLQNKSVNPHFIPRGLP